MGKYSLQDFFNIFPENWNKWSVIITTLIGVCFSFLSAFEKVIPKRFFIPAVVITLCSIFVLVFHEAYRKQVVLYKQVLLGFEKTDTFIKKQAEQLGYKRKKVTWSIESESGGTARSTMDFIIENTQNLVSVPLFRLLYKDIREHEMGGDFIESFNRSDDGKVIADMTFNWNGQLLATAKFNPELPKNSAIDIKTKEFLFPIGWDDPQEFSKSIKRDGGKVVYFTPLVPTDEIDITVVLPPNIEYLAPECFGSRYCAVARTDTDHYLEKDNDAAMTFNSGNSNSKTKNIFKLNVKYPTMGYSYFLCWVPKKGIV